MSGELTAADWYGHWGDYQRLLAGAIAPLDAVSEAPHLGSRPVARGYRPGPAYAHSTPAI
jgi:hypothetical protein